MYNASDLEQHFNKFTKNLTQWLPEGILEIDIITLHQLGLLSYYKGHDSTLTRYFHVVESPDKITLINGQFIVWIIPKNHGTTSRTCVLIALNDRGIPKMELAFEAKDVYNTSSLVLRLLEKILFEIQENEESLKAYREIS
ncbi:Uncharacterized protein PHSC3_001951 [Chlamydiales bacterium STE3]|nr:Uncharacterized protein PHSC3_001951 [Chlamydiales bacterium STE3]